MSDIDNQLADEIYRVLIGYKCAFTQIEDDGGAMPLVDLLSPGKTIAEGREECSELAAEIAEAVSRHFAGLAEDAQRMTWLEEREASYIEDAFGIGIRSCIDREMKEAEHE